jgi:hypothetical protein
MTTPSEIVFKDYKTFNILNCYINIVSEELNNFTNTLAEIDGQVYYLGEESYTISSAIFAWQEVNKRELTTEELVQVLKDNSLISD